MRLQLTLPVARRTVGVLLLALLLAQGSALLHAVAHAPVTGGALHGQAQAEQAGDGDAHGDHAAGSPVCQLVDHLLFGAAPGSPTLIFAAPRWPSAAPQAWPARAVRARAAAAYDARGPPRA